jgi:hypothetical protein
MRQPRHQQPGYFVGEHPIGGRAQAIKLPLSDISHRKPFNAGCWRLKQMRKRGASRVASEPLEILIRIEADDMNFDRAVGVAQSPLQQSAKLAQ